MRSMRKIEADIKSCEEAIERRFSKGEDTAKTESMLLQLQDERAHKAGIAAGKSVQATFEQMFPG